MTTIPRVFDRIPHFDERSRSFPIRALIPTVKPRSFTWKVPVQLDQGSEGACVGFGVSHEAAARPVCIPSVTNDTARALYYRARQLDDFPGEDYEGSSVLGGIKAGREHGWYPEFRWAFGLDDLVLAVGYKGPVVIGVDWWTGMMELDAKGFIHPTGIVEGGHCTLVNQVNVKEKWAKIWNSWGGAVNGKITFDDLGQLLSQRGEACVPVKRAKGAA